MADAAKTSASQSAAKQALVELKRMQAKLDAAERGRSESIAICGMGMRFPGRVNDADSYWRLLAEGTDAITEIPSSRWDVDALYDADPAAPGKTYSRHGGFIEGIENFDAEFFGLSPREASCTDPQQRLLLEVTWEALENAAIAPAGLARSRTGVFIGIGNSDYGRMLVDELDAIDAHTGTGSAIAVAAGRLSYALGLNGPSLVVDTACSSSLTAVALACESLRRRECDLALAGGSNLILTPEYHIAFSKARMLAPDGRCKTFDARADGYVRGEGCAVIVLKRLSDALADDDPILAVVRGFAVNQDGASSGLTVPNGPAQEAVVRAALENGKVAPADVDYVEAHGTATSLGDPIEVHALGAVFADRPQGRPLLIGSVKSNVGHLEAAAGVAGIIKVVLALRHRKLPATLHFERPSPQIDWARCPVKVVSKLTDWKGQAHQRLAGVSAFGFSGTNAHVLLGEAPDRESDQASTDEIPALVCLSAKTPAALGDLATRYAERFQADSPSLQQIARSANSGRSHLNHRLAVIAEDVQQLRKQLAEFGRSGRAAGCTSGVTYDADAPQVALLFGGDGSQYTGMGRGYYEHYPVFRAAFDECDKLLQPTLGCSLTERLFGGRDRGDWAEPASFGQPALFSLQYALARLWQSWGIEIAAVLGHGLGEYAAACVAGVFDVEAGLSLSAARGRLFEAAETVSLAAVRADADSLRELIGDQAQDFFLAADNGPQSCVVAGAPDKIQTFAKRLARDGIEATILDTAGSLPPDAGAEREYVESIAGKIEYATPKIPLVAGRYGRFVDRELCVASAWVPEPRQTVYFRSAMQCLRDDGQRIFIEIGPQPILLPIARRDVPDEDAVWIAAARRGQSDQAMALQNLATLYVNGVDLRWEGLAAGGRGVRIALPTYPFQREAYWWSRPRQTAATRGEAPRWDRVVAAGRDRAALVPIDMDVRGYAAKWGCLDSLTRAYMVEALRSLGLFATAGETHSAESLVTAGGIKPVYTMLMSRWLQYLTGTGDLQQDGDTYVAAQPLEAPPIAPALAAATDTLADIPELLAYVRRCGETLVDVLLDRESALQTLFPGGAPDTARFLYRDWAVPRYFNGIASAVIERFTDTLPAGRGARIVEIGAGTGATTASVLPALASRDVQYWFTDVSDYFLSQASQEFSDYAFVQYGLLDIGKNPAEQGYGTHSFDVVVAANVLHATTHLEQTVDQVLSLLAPGGILVLFETTGAPNWSEITVGLIEGWQSFADGLRKDSPLLSAAQWTALLKERGFDNVVELPAAGSPAEIFGSHIIVAQVGEDRDLAASAARNPSTPAEAIPVSGAVPDGGVDQEAVAALRERLDEAASNERADLLLEYVRNGVNRVLRRNPDKPLDRRQRLMDLGVDSLMAVELRNVLTVGLGLGEPLPATLIFDYPTIQAVAEFLETRLDGSAAADVSAPAQAPAMSAEAVEALSDEEVKAALRAKIGES